MSYIKYTCALEKEKDNDRKDFVQEGKKRYIENHPILFITNRIYLNYLLYHKTNLNQ